VAQYGNDPVIDPNGQAISDGYDTSMDPRAEAISRAVEQYGQQILDPRAEAISHAVAQYVADNGGDSHETQQRVTNSVREGASEYIDQAGVKRPGITKRHVNRMIQIMVPNAMLPINGYWRILPFSVTTSGNCIDTYGDNDGPPVNGGDDDPGQPLCGYAEAGELPFIVWNGNLLPYLPGSSSIYSEMPLEQVVVTHDRGGASTGSLLVTTTTEYEVVAPDRIQVHLLIQEEGGCSMSADYIIELVTADESVCPPMSSVSTPEPTPEPPEVVEGPYTVGLPFYTDEAQCNDVNTPPQLGDELRLLEQPDGSIIIDYGTGTQQVYGGNGYYEFDTGMSVSMRQLVTLVLFDDGSGGSVAFSNNAKDGNICYISHDLSLPGFEPDEPVSTPVPDDPSSGTSGDIPPAPALTTGNYTVTWSAFPGLECSSALDAMLPKFTEATITANGAGYTLTAGGVTYDLTETSGQYMSIVFEPDNSGVTLSMYDGALAALPAGHWGGSYTYFAADSSMCMNQLDFTPVG
jgi:hypothetical protein